MDADSKKSLFVGAGIFLLTVSWAFFLDQLAITPDSLLRLVGNPDQFSFIFSGPFAAFAFLFALTLGLISAYADKDERGRVYVAAIVPTILACGISALLFANFAQWYPLALFYFGSIPLIIETTRLKRLELKNFAVPRSSFSGVQRGMQVLGVGILVTLAITALPQNESLYSNFQNALFAGKVVQQVNVEKITADFLITTQRNTLMQIMATEAFEALRQSTTPADVQFVSLMQQSLDHVNSPEYRAEVVKQVNEQQRQIDPQALVDQLEQTIPGYKTLKENYWLLSAFLGSLLFFLVTMFILQPLAAVLGTGLYNVIPADGTTGMMNSIKGSPAPGLWNTLASSPGVAQDKTTGWSAPPAGVSTDISATPEEVPVPVVPEYTHTDEKPVA